LTVHTAPAAQSAARRHALPSAQRLQPVPAPPQSTSVSPASTAPSKQVAGGGVALGVGVGDAERDAVWLLVTDGVADGATQTAEPGAAVVPSAQTAHAVAAAFAAKVFGPQGVHADEFAATATLPGAQALQPAPA